MPRPGVRGEEPVRAPPLATRIRATAKMKRMSDIDMETCWNLWPALRTELGPKAEADDLRSHIEQHGDMAFSWMWDSGNPGAGAGRETVIGFGDHFFARSDVEYLGFTGPYPTIDRALQALELILEDGGAIRWDAVLEGIDCPVMSTDDLILRLDLSGDRMPNGINLNGDSHEWDAVLSRQQELLQTRVESLPSPSRRGSPLKGKPRGPQLTDLYDILSDELGRPNPQLEIRNAPEALNGWAYLRTSDPDRGASMRYRMLEGCVELIIPRSQQDEGWVRDRLESHPLPGAAVTTRGKTEISVWVPTVVLDPAADAEAQRRQIRSAVRSLWALQEWYEDFVRLA